MKTVSSDLLTTAQAAERLSVTPRHIRWLIDKGRLKGQRVGRDYVIAAGDLAQIERRPVGRPRKQKS